MGLMKKLTSAVVASSLVLGLAGAAFAAPTADEQSASYARMSGLNLVVGTDKGPELDGPLTRAQLLTIIVRAFGQEGTAALLKGMESFSDVPGGEWYSGYVAVAKNLAAERGFVVGYPDGTFQPNNQVTVIEALAMIMKFLGVPTGTGDNWVAQTIENAKAAGVITDADVEKFFAEPNAAATRGVAFALADQIFATYNKLPGGKTVYTTYVDAVAPALTVTKPAAPTTSAATYTVQGIAEAGAEVFVNDEKVTVGANGAFSVEVALAGGENTITVSARDLAGNVTSETIVLNRVAGAAAKIVAEALEVAAGAQAELAFKVVDENDLELADAAADVEVTLSEGIGSYEDGIFTASEKAGKGTITLTLGELTAVIDVTVVPGPLASVKAETESVAPGEAVKLFAVDEFGNAIEGATFSENSANAFIEGDEFTATKSGEYTVTATVGEVSKEGTILVYGELDDLVIEAKDEIVANGETEYEVVVKAVDDNGAIVRDFDGDIILTSEDADLEITSDAAVKAVDGVATFKVKAHADGIFEVEATAEDEDLSVTADIKAVEQKATGLKVEADDYLSVGWSGIDTKFTVKIVDQAGEPMLDYGDGYDVTVRVSGPAYLKDTETQDDGKSLTTWIDKSHDFWLISTDEEGTVTITATAEGLKEGSDKVSAVYAGAPRKLVIKKDTADTLSNGSIYRIGVTDSKGVPVVFNDRDDNRIALTFHTADVDVEYGDTKGVWEPADPDSDSNKVFYVEFRPGDQWVYVKVADGAASGKPSSVTMKAAADGLTMASATLEYKATDATGFKVAGASQIPGLDYGYRVAMKRDSTSEMEFQLVDADGKAVQKAVRVKFEVLPGSEVKVNGKDDYTTYTDSNGKVKVRINLPYYEDNGTIVITADGDRDGSLGGDAGATLDVIAATSKAKNITIDQTGLVFDVQITDSAKNALDLSSDVTALYKLTKNGALVDLDKVTAGDQFEELVTGTTTGTIDLTTVIGSDTGKFVLTVYTIDSLYNPTKSVSFEILPAATGIGFAGEATGDDLTLTGVKDNVTKSVTVQLRDGDDQADDLDDDWKVVVKTTASSAVGQVYKNGRWETVDSTTGVEFDLTTQKEITLRLRGITSYGDVEFVVEALNAANGGTTIGTPLTVTLTK
ncbi:S-layer homology domain-containing protein [Symbiobacterium terraclitae]|uniref:S-layer homology domain-containing protein n=1 Tax=Symbiobacterium terraclitae TaxID=557451 RepID=UPI0035B52A51